ncbi:MAG: SDR family NAD(P)-dependent oxidoreductase [Ktedonobacterales bacterium]
MAGKLAGKVALVTGASSGIGEATALALAAEGARVAIAARRMERLDELAKRIQEQGGEALALEIDVTDEAKAREMVDRTRKQWGRLDILVNNAGVMLLGPITGARVDDWQRMINLNLLGLMYATHEALPIMQKQGSGHIVNVSSVAGRVARAGSGGYNATKWGVNAFSEALRQELAQRKEHIRVTLIEPGMVATELASHITNEQARRGLEERARTTTPLQPEDISAAILYAVTQPERVNVNEILIRPIEQEG